MGLKIGSTFGLYKLVWQAELICALVGSNTTTANAKSAVASLFARSFATNEQFAFAA